MIAIAQYTTPDGYTFTISSNMYMMDWGLEITGPDHKTREIKELYYSPCAMSLESYGVHFEDDEGNELDEGIEWTEAEWVECLQNEAGEFLEAFLG